MWSSFARCARLVGVAAAISAAFVIPRHRVRTLLGEIVRQARIYVVEHHFDAL